MARAVGSVVIDTQDPDVVVDDLDEATAQAEALGGRWTEPGSTRDLDGFLWRCMADPEGNEFCIFTLPPNR